MREIIKVLLNEGLEREDVVAICKYIKEEYEVVEATASKYAEFQGDALDTEILAKRQKEAEEQEKNMKVIELANKERAELEAIRKRAAEKLNK